MFDSLLNLCAVFIFFAGPTWAGELTGLLPVYLAVTAAQLVVILLATSQPARSTSGAGRAAPRLGRATLTTEAERLAEGRPRAAARRLLRVVLTVMAIAALNFVLNLIWPFRF